MTIGIIYWLNKKMKEINERIRECISDDIDEKKIYILDCCDCYKYNYCTHLFEKRLLERFKEQEGDPADIMEEEHEELQYIIDEYNKRNKIKHDF